MVPDQCCEKIDCIYSYMGLNHGTLWTPWNNYVYSSISTNDKQEISNSFLRLTSIALIITLKRLKANQIHTQGRYNLFKTGCATHFTAQKSGCAKSILSLHEAQKVGAQMCTLRIRLYRPCVCLRCWSLPYL